MTEKRTTRADRDVIADLLSMHYALGSINDEEFAERTDAAMEAKFPSELVALTADLADLPPEPVPPVPEPSALVRIAGSTVAWFRSQPGGVQVFLALMALMCLVSLLSRTPAAIPAWVAIAIVVLAVIRVRRNHRGRQETPVNSRYRNGWQLIQYPDGTTEARSWPAKTSRRQPADCDHRESTARREP